MISDHKYLDKIWAEFLIEKDFDKAEKIFKKFNNRYAKHMKMEDEVLFPLFNKYLGLENNTGPTKISHRDHENLNKLLVNIKNFIDVKDIKKINETSLNFQKALSKHQERENITQYALFNKFISISVDGWEKMLHSIYKTKGKHL